jgi:hypothetical protein
MPGVSHVTGDKACQRKALSADKRTASSPSSSPSIAINGSCYLSPRTRLNKVRLLPKQHQRQSQTSGRCRPRATPGEWVRDQSLFRSRLNKGGALLAWQGGTRSPNFSVHTVPFWVRNRHRAPSGGASAAQLCIPYVLICAQMSGHPGPS